ncbi:universal stress protein [Haloarchaeobius sp. HME9146]|uniref:universal stress protein n=1 Tax=Haloarchaeobius sp. HME9146 TaxID=2978732 RepID=UPI0021BE3B36|nr:universal stress protein [Haloarchaeobius sp. HME9146]MCT9097147.1 universal stress protein [Haloarchaeobius sp. HME9146]
MTRVVVPVRYPLTKHSRRTLESAVEVAREHEAALTVLHVNLYQESKRVTRADLKRATEREFGPLEHVRYVVRRGFLVEETILDEVASESADIVVIGNKQAGRWRRMLRKLVDDPNIDQYLRKNLDCEVITVRAA